MRQHTHAHTLVGTWELLFSVCAKASVCVCECKNNVDNFYVAQGMEGGQFGGSVVQWRCGGDECGCGYLWQLKD